MPRYKLSSDPLILRFSCSIKFHNFRDKFFRFVGLFTNNSKVFKHLKKDLGRKEIKPPVF